MDYYAAELVALLGTEWVVLFARNFQLQGINYETYNVKVQKYIESKQLKSDIEIKIQRAKRNAETELRAEKEQSKISLNKLKEEVVKLRDDFLNTLFCNLTKEDIQTIIHELDDSLLTSYQEMKVVHTKIFKKFKNERVKIGSKYAGGIVFYLEKDGKHGLVVAEEDQPDAIWQARIDDKYFDLGTKKSFGAGRQNTELIVEKGSHVFKGFLSKRKVSVPTAGLVCAESQLNGHKDWYLPSLFELEKIYSELHKNKLGSFRNVFYWSSSEAPNEYYAYGKNFSGWTVDEYERKIIYHEGAVRAIRTF